MNNELYNDVQADLGAISDSFKSDVAQLLKESDADDSVKKLISEYANITNTAISSLCRAISQLGTSLVN